MQQSEELRQPRLHLIDVGLEVGDDLAFVLRLPLRIAVDRGAEGGKVLVALRLGQLGHLRRDPRHLLQAQRVDGLRREVDGGHGRDRGKRRYTEGPSDPEVGPQARDHLGDEERSTLESPWRWPVAVAIRKRLLSSEEYHQMLGAGIRPISAG